MISDEGPAEFVESVDLALACLLADLSELDALPAEPIEARLRVIGSALVAARVLEDAGGGSLGIERVREIKSALLVERERTR
jgi:hypothetical protein